MDKNNYIYGLFNERPKNNFLPKLFYIGRGQGRRMNKHFGSLKNDTNDYKCNVIKKCRRNSWDCYPIKLVENLSKDEAKELEQFILQDNDIFSELTNISQSCHGGTDKIGEDFCGSKLINKEASEIKWLLHNTDCIQKDIAREYNISPQVLSDIKHERSWKHIDPEKADNYNNIKTIEDIFLSTREKQEIKWLLENTQLSQKKIEEKYNTTSPVSDINVGKVGKNLDPKKPDQIPKGQKQTFKLSKQEAAEIKWLLENTKLKNTPIGDHYNVTSTTVWEIDDNRIHKDVQPQQPDKTPNGEKHEPNLKELVPEIKWYLENTNLPQKEIGNKFGFCRKTISSINCEKRYPNLKPSEPVNQKEPSP